MKKPLCQALSGIPSEGIRLIKEKAYDKDPLDQVFKEQGQESRMYQGAVVSCPNCKESGAVRHISTLAHESNRLDGFVLVYTEDNRWRLPTIPETGYPVS